MLRNFALSKPGARFWVGFLVLFFCGCVLQPSIPVIPIMLSAPHMYHISGPSRSADISCLSHLACDLIYLTCNLLTYLQEDGHLCSCTPLLLQVCGTRLVYLGLKGCSTQPFFSALLSFSLGPRDAYSRDEVVAIPLSLLVSRICV